MHIADGVVSAPVWIAGSVLAAGGIAVGLRRLRDEQIPQTALLTAAFFVASLLHLQTGLQSTHLVLNGLIGLLLGWAAFPAIAIGLLLQCLFFGHGGLTTLGLNTVNLAAPAVLCWYLFGRGKPAALWRGAAAGALAIFCSAVLVALCLRLTQPAFAPLANAVVLVQLPVAVCEGIISAVAVSFIGRVRPALLPTIVPAEG